MSWKFVRFHEIQNQTDAKNFRIALFPTNRRHNFGIKDFEQYQKPDAYIFLNGLSVFFKIAGNKIRLQILAKTWSNYLTYYSLKCWRAYNNFDKEWELVLWSLKKDPKLMFSKMLIEKSGPKIQIDKYKMSSISVLKIYSLTFWL